MSKKSIIPLEEISSVQVDTESVLGIARTDGSVPNDPRRDPEVNFDETGGEES